MFGIVILLTSALALVVLVLTIVMLHEATHPPRRTAGYAVARGLPVDPGEMRLEYDEWVLDRPNGVQLPVWEIEGRSQASTRITAVFIHGWGHSRIDSLSRVEPWLAWCHRVVLYDLRGHGEAIGPITHLGGGEDDDLLSLLEQFGSWERGIEASRDQGSGPRTNHLDASMPRCLDPSLARSQFILVGHSMGAVIAIAAAARESKVKDAIAGVVAYGPYMDFHGSLRGRLRAHGYPTRPMTDLMLLWLKLRNRPPLNLDDRIANLQCPLFVVHGTHDLVSPMVDAQRIVHLVPQAQLREVQGAVHSDPQLFNHPEHLEELAAFMNEVVAVSASGSA